MPVTRSAVSMRARSPIVLLVLAIALLGGVEGRRKRGGGSRGGRGHSEIEEKPKAPSPPTPTGFAAIECKKCMSIVMHLLTASDKGCKSGNATSVKSSSDKRAGTVYCETLIPKKRQCIGYSFRSDGAWDYESALVARGCRMLSFDPFCCGAAHKIKPNHDFVPVGLAPYDGVTDSGAPDHPNVTYPVLSMKTIMESYEHRCAIRVCCLGAIASEGRASQSCRRRSIRNPATRHLHTGASTCCGCTRARMRSGRR